MLSGVYIALRFIHFMALMVLLGSTISCSLLASRQFKPVLIRRLKWLWQSAVWMSMLSALLLLCAQAGMMGSGWQDAFRPEIWLAVLGTSFGAVWLWQILLSVVAVVVLILKPRILQPMLLILTAAQLILMAGVGHAAMREGVIGGLQRLNQAIHLLSASWWVGGLLPLLMCMHMANKPRWRQDAITAMMRFSRYGHLAVAVVIISGLINSVMILGWSLPLESDYFRLLMLKVLLVTMMVIIALYNRYFLVPRFNRVPAVTKTFIQLTRLEVILSVGVLLTVSVFATLEPY